MEERISLLFEYSSSAIGRNQKPNLPVYATSGSSGFDIEAYLPVEEQIIQPGEIKLIPTGWIFNIPVGKEVQIRARSGLALKNGITLANSVGTIDQDYKQEVKIILINHGKEPFTITNGMRIAQGVLADVIRADLKIENSVASEPITFDRIRVGGFGSTGLHHTGC